MLTLIAAIGNGRVIGTPDGRIPWPKIRADLKHFKSSTMGHTCIVGRKTFDVMGILPGRKLLVVTRGESVSNAPASVEFVKSVDEAIDRAAELDPHPMVVGGGEIYRQTIDRADSLIITAVNFTTPVPERGDNVTFPYFSDQDWDVVTTLRLVDVLSPGEPPAMVVWYSRANGTK